MPWVNKKKCVSCKKCVKKCPVDAISMMTGKARVDHDGCINCGKCVKVCPVKAILKDKDQVDIEVASKVELFKKSLSGSKNGKIRRRMVKARIRRINMEKKIIQATLKELKNMK
jgi:ferredoxin